MDFKARRLQHASPSAGSNDPENLHLHHYVPNPPIDTTMDMDSTIGETTKSRRVVPKEERRPSPAQNDIFTRSTLSLNTRRNRRLNYLLRYLAPPTSAESQAGAATAPSTKGRRSSSDPRLYPHPSLASILSISGSMSNLSFSDSTYFSDAEMQARAPELYQQYIGRFMDDDDTGDDSDPDSDDDGDGDTTGAEADDEREREGGRRRANSGMSHTKPFDKDVGLVDRILWNIDHPTKRQQKLQKQEEMDRQNKYQEGKSGIMQDATPDLPSQDVPSQDVGYVALSESRIGPTAPKPDSTEEFEEEFDTESDEGDDTMGEDDRRGPLRSLRNDDEILHLTSVTPPIPPDPTPGLLSSTMSSAAMTLEQPEVRARFAEVENGNGLISEEEEEDQETEKRKEDQESMRQEFVLLMKQQFLDGLDINFDYSTVDFDENLDDLDQEDHDTEDRWFDADEDDGSEGGDDGEDAEVHQGSPAGKGPGPKKAGSDRSRALSKPLTSSSGLNYDERVLAWESSAQNGPGDYDY